MNPRATWRQQLGRARWGLQLAWSAAPRQCALSVALVSAQAALPVLQLIFIGKLVDWVGHQMAKGETLLTTGSGASIALVLVAIAIAGAVLDSAISFNREALALRVTDFVQGLIHQQSSRLDLEHFDTPEYYDHLHRAQREGGSRPAQLVGSAIQLGAGLSTFVSVALLLVFVQPALVVVGSLSVLPLLVVRLRQARNFFEWRQGRTQEERKAAVVDSILNQPAYAKETRLLNLGDHLAQKHKRLREELREGRLAFVFRQSITSIGARAFTAVGLLVALVWLLGTGHGTQALTAGSLVVFVQAYQRLLATGEQALTAGATMSEGAHFIENLRTFLNLTPRIVDPANPKDFPTVIQSGISFRDVGFQYLGQESWALRNLSLDLPAGKITALVGENGAGKSTLVKLLCRLHDPTEGSVSIDGHDLRDFRVADVRAACSVVLQDFSRFPLTVRENVGVGDLTKLDDDDALKAAAAQAGALGLIDRLPAGLETPLGKWFAGGRELSSGEWQSVALARAMLRQAPILVLDEPSSALDPHAEARMFGRIKELAAGRTVLLISHRFSTVALADRIIVLDQGKVVEQGSHQELMEKRAIYASLYSAQADRYV